jgi:uncharacterized membrane protein YeiB
MSVFTKEDHLQILKDIVEIKTVNDNEIEVAKYLKDLLEKHGIKADIDEIKGHNNRANLIASIGEGHPVVAISGHMDVVSEDDSNNWQFPPFELTEQDGFLYGRGTSDVKAGLEMIKKDLGDSYGLLLLFSIFINFPLFTLGIYFSKSNWFEKNAKQFWSCKLFIYMIPIALIGKSIMYWSNHNNSTDGISFLSGTLLSIGIICLFKKVYQSHRQNWIMQNLKYMGKMSLTMYIMQSIIGTLIFYSYGLGLFGKDILLYIALLFIIIYIAQVYLATWYQRHLRYGPLEYLLRMFTYWKWNVNKK